MTFVPQIFVINAVCPCAAVQITVLHVPRPVEDELAALSIMNILLIVTSVTFLWRRSESIARPAFIRADEKGGNSVKSGTQKLQEQDGILRDGDEVESRMRQGRRRLGECCVRAACRQYHWDTRRTSLSIPPVP